MPREMMVIPVTLEDRPDGGLRVTSNLLPGLILSGGNKPAICDAIAPAIRYLLEAQGLRIVAVYPGVELAEVLKSPSPRDVNMHVQQFVVELELAAASVPFESEVLRGPGFEPGLPRL